MEPLGTDELASPGRVAPLLRFEKRRFPWWLVWMIGLIVFLVVLILRDPEFREAFESIFQIPWQWSRGLALTLILTVGSFVASMVLGLFIGLGRLSNYTGPNRLRRVLSSFVSNLSTFYIELIRGVPMIVFIFFVGLVLVPSFVDLLNLESRAVTEAWRGAAALSLFYAAFIAEVFRAGIQSVPDGQSEAGRAVGLNEPQILRHIVLPQAVRNMLPALGNDLISLMKDTSLVSVLSARELTFLARQYQGVSFRTREAFLILMAIYVVLTFTLSLLLRWYERRISVPGY